MLIRTDTLQPWRGEALAGLRHPVNIETLWTPQELTAAGLVREVPATIPGGHRRTGPSTWNGSGVETIPTEPIPPPTAEEVDRGKEATLENELATLAFRVLFDHENRVRALEQKAPITAAQFRAALKARL